MGSLHPAEGTNAGDHPGRGQVSRPSLSRSRRCHVPVVVTFPSLSAVRVHVMIKVRSTTSRVASQHPKESAAIRLQRRVWDRRARTWDHGGAKGLQRVVDAVLRTADVGPGEVVVDLGAGTGQLSLPMGCQGALVTAVDVSPAMIEGLEEKAARAGLDSVTGMVAAVEELTMPAGSTDAVVSNYALHHLSNRQKAAVVRAAAEWLRPGGRLVIGDMMFGQGRTSRDRAIILSKVLVLAKRGPAGWWRVAKNMVKFSVRIQERPVPIERWTQYFEEAGLVEVSSFEVAAEAAVVSGRRPMT